MLLYQQQFDNLNIDKLLEGHGDTVKRQAQEDPWWQQAPKHGWRKSII